MSHFDSRPRLLIVFVAFGHIVAVLSRPEIILRVYVCALIRFTVSPQRIHKTRDFTIVTRYNKMTLFALFWPKLSEFSGIVTFWLLEPQIPIWKFSNLG